MPGRRHDAEPEPLEVVVRTRNERELVLAPGDRLMLPAGTPPNAIVFAHPGMRVGVMAKSGAVLDLTAIAVITLLVLLLGGPVLGID